MPLLGSLGTIGRVLVIALAVTAILLEITTLVGAGISGYIDGNVKGSINNPSGMTIDSLGNLYVLDYDGNLRKITSTGQVTTFLKGSLANVSFGWPSVGMATDSLGNIYIDDNNFIRKITPAGVVTNIAGNGLNQPAGLAVDSSGNLYVADRWNHRILKISPASVVTTLAGNGTAALTNGTGSNASFQYPWGIAVDSAGNVYVCDSLNHCIRKITAAGVVTTFAGNGTSGTADGTGTNARFYNPYHMTIDSVGNLYIYDYYWALIRKVTPAGVVTRLAGNGGSIGTTFADGTGTETTFYSPLGGLALDSVGNLYLSDSGNHRIRKITSTGVVTTFAGDGTTNYVDTVQNGATSGALLNLPRAVAVDSSSTMYVADTTNHRIRKITSTGVVTTLAGSGTAQFADGVGTNASFNSPQGISVDSGGNVYVGDTLNNRVRKITPEGVVTTLAGSGTAQFADGTGTAASFNNPYGVTVDSAGIVYVIDKLNYRVRKITSAGVVTTLAGNGTAQYLEGSGTAARFLNPFGIVVNSAGTMMYVTDSNYIRKITSAGVTTFIAGQATAGSANATGVSASFNGPREIALLAAGTSVYVADTGNHIIRRVTTDFGVTTKYSGFGGAGFRETPVANVQYNTPSGIAVNSAGLVYVADTNNNRIRTIAAGSDNTGVVTTVVGTSTAGYSDGGGWFNSPFGVATDWDGTVYIADTINNYIRKITPAGVVTSLAGNGTGTFADGTGTSASFNQPRGVALGSDGTVYVADTTNNRIRRITPAGVVTIVAGNAQGSTNGTGTSATLNAPNAITVNSSDIMYVADTGNHRIRAITQARVVTTFAGTTQGFQDGVGTNARFDTPQGIVADIYGNVYVADTNNHRIRRITSDGTVTTLAGQATAGFANGIGTSAQFNFPYHLSIDALGTLYVADQTNNRIRTVQTSTGVVSTLAGTGLAGFTASSFNSPQGITVDRFQNAYVGDTGNHSIRKIANAFTLPENNAVVTTFAGDGTAAVLDGTGIGARFNNPVGITFDSVGNLYIADQTNHRIRRITPAGVVTVFAGNATATFADGTGTNASFNNPSGVAVDSAGNVYVGDFTNNRIRRITPAGVVTTFAGSTSGSADGTGTNATFNNPYGIAVDSGGNVYVGDSNNNRIRKITSAGVVSTFSTSVTNPAGVAVDSAGIVYVANNSANRISRITSAGVVSTLAGGGTTGSANGTGTNATFSSPNGVAVDSVGTVYVADSGNNLIRRITASGVVTTLAGSTGAYQDGIGTNATFSVPRGLTVDSAGNVYVADSSSHRIRKIGTTVAQMPLNRGVVTTFAGNGGQGSGDGTGTNATFNNTYGVAVDLVRNVYVADTNNHRIRRITPAGVVSIFAGTTAGFLDGTGTSAQFLYPRGVTVDSLGTVYVADTYNNRIRKITPSGVVTTFAGGGSFGAFAEGTGTNARFNYPDQIIVDLIGTVYVTDGNNNRIRKITSAGVVSTLAGSTYGYADGAGTNAQFQSATGIAIDSTGTLYVADTFNHRIRKITPSGVVTTIAGNGNLALVDGVGTNTSFNYPNGIALDSAGNLYVGESGNPCIRRITPAGVVTTFAGQATGGSTNGTGTNAMFGGINGLVLGLDGIMYVSEGASHRIRKVQ